MDCSDRIYVAGGDTLVGAALLGQLRARGYSVVNGGRLSEPDLTDRVQVEAWFEEARPDSVFLLQAGRGYRCKPKVSG